MRLLLALLFVGVFSCASDYPPPEPMSKVTDCGRIQIGTNLWLAKVIVEPEPSFLHYYRDNVYFLVNDSNRVVAGATATYRVGKSEETTATLYYSK